ncbi:DUF5956 family protein [Amycolatopsis sp.]|jgi:hypothetical protein|uniref:DUF5956 family protein n=1 Tax=Amycolatopsis sp. TaxID=37632 RepID=UPI002E0BCFDD|nr:DUF5956 family protein [Amycolatopsis sp.]
MSQAASPPEQWQQVPLLSEDTQTTALPGRAGGPDSARLEIDGTVYDQVPETGFGMLIAWLAGSGRLVRMPDREPQSVTITAVTATGTASYRVPRTSTDQEVIDEGIEDYLTAADIPNPPRGHRWYQSLPEGHGTLDDAYAHINAALRSAAPDNAATHPRDIARLLTDIVTTLYRQ